MNKFKQVLGVGPELGDPLVNRQTDTGESIIFPQTMYTGRNYNKSLNRESKALHLNSLTTQMLKIEV